MKKLFSLILIAILMILPCAWAEEEDWYLIRAAKLVEDMKQLSTDTAYIEMMGGNEETRTLIEAWSQAIQQEPVSILKGSIPMAQLVGPSAAAMGVGEVGVRQLGRGSIGMAVNVLIGQHGTNFLAASSMIQIGEGYVMPEDFEACAVVYEYADVAVAVCFKEAGEGVVLATAQFCPTEICSMIEAEEESAKEGAQVNEGIRKIMGN